MNPSEATCSRPIVLVGLPGSGKSTIGKHLARRLSIDFFDSDAVIERSEGISIRELFRDKGEDRFREIEASTIDDLTQKSNCVISTGGGTILSPTNRETIVSRCKCIYLRATPEDLFLRLRNDRKRPLLQVADPLSALRELFKVRDPLYSSVATCTIDTGQPSIHALVNVISSKLKLDFSKSSAIK